VFVFFLCALSTSDGLRQGRPVLCFSKLFRGVFREGLPEGFSSSALSISLAGASPFRIGPGRVSQLDFGRPAHQTKGIFSDGRFGDYGFT